MLMIDIKVLYPCRSLFQAALKTMSPSYIQSYNATVMAQYLLFKKKEKKKTIKKKEKKIKTKNN